jgi:hypothetical protein
MALVGLGVERTMTEEALERLRAWNEYAFVVNRRDWQVFTRWDAQYVVGRLEAQEQPWRDGVPPVDEDDR